MATVITSPIPNIETPWENYSGDSVEQFIKDTFNAKYGWLYRTPEKLSDGFYHIYAFASQDSYQEWREMGDPSLIIQNISLPNPENASYAVELTTNSSTSKLVNLGDGVKIGLKFTSTSTDPYTLITTDTGNDGTLYIQKYNNGFWITQARLQIESVPIASDTYTQVDITEYLSDGDNKIRVRVDDNVNGQSSANIVFNSIVNTTLALENVTSQTNPLTAMTFNYYIQGRITKTLNIKLTTSDVVINYTFPIGESIYTETYYTTPVISGTFHTGIISVESWLSVDDYPELESTHVFNEYYFVNSEEPEADPVLIINNLVDSVTNYTPANFFNFILFNQSVDVTVKFYDSTRTTTYLSYTYQNCPVNTLMTFSNELQIESEAPTVTSIIVITTGQTILAQESITVDNSVNFNPTAGADFVLNPQTRSNSETNKNTIINQQNGAVISSTFSNFDFVNDGWVKDEENISVLRVPTGRTLTINYDVLSNITNGTTFEMDFKVRNVFDDDSVVFRFCEYSGTTLYGFEMKSLEAAFGTQQNTVRRDQDVMFSDETRTHLAVNIIPNLSNSGLNYIRIFINGIINREMLYNSNDIFKLSSQLPIIIGGEDVDIDIYSMRVYKKSLSSENIRQDYISAIPTKEEKLAFKEANNILANSIISYDLASVKYNTLVWTGTPASYQNQGEGIGNGTLTINIIGKPECSGSINNMTCKGQGSSSKGYWKWNQQYGFSDDSVWIDGNGETRGKYYKITDDAQPAKKLVAKLNWASSMQSHKIGATAMYDDLWKRVIGGNSITNTEGYESCRIAVKEEPFLFFTKSSENANPVFYGLVTFGPGKGDKPTFGYYPSVFPYQLWVEGSDNGLPLISRQVPWIDDDVTYNSDEEFFEYANSGNIDVNMGDLSLYTEFRDAYNYTFLHSQRLRPFTGNIPSNADVTYQYWNDSTMNVYRYDYINLEWVNAGITKENGDYTVLNLESQTGLLRTNYSSNDEYNAAVIAWRTADFRSGISTYYNVNDCLFTMAFLKIIAASDNRCKNTYEYLDPTTRLICLWQDDMDTILATDNVGRKNKPYYVEEHDIAPNGNNYWNGEDNVFYNLMESAFAVELRGMINSIFSAMRTEAGTVQQCMYNYFFYVQNYFPAVAYNETTRLLYEQASVAQRNGQYTNGTPAITQALGDQLQTEKMWWKRREPYMESLSAATPFAARSTGSLGFRANTMLDGGGNASPSVSFNFEVTPQQWLYPKVGAGQSLGGDNTRVEALDDYTTNIINTSSDTDCFIYGADYYVNYGEFVNIPVGEVFELTGQKLLEFSADSRNATVAVQFRPTAMTVNCPNLRSLTLYGISSLTGSLDLSACTKLQSLDLRGTNITSVILPESYDLTTAYLPSTLMALTANNVPNLSTLNIVDYSTIRSINTDNSTLALTVIDNASNLSNVTLNNININTTAGNVDDVLDILTEPNVVCNITGSIYLAKSLTSTEKNAIELKFGSNVFLPTSALYISFISTPITTVTLTASKNGLGNNDTLYIDVTMNGTDDADYSWSVNSSNNLNITRTKTRLTLQSTTLTTLEQLTITYTLTKTNLTTITETINVNVIPYTFYVNGTEFSQFTQNMLFGSGDSSVTYTDGWTVTCNDQEVVFSINGVTVSGGSAVYSGNTISSITKTTLSNNSEYDCTVSLLINSLSIDYVFKIKTILVSMSINNIDDIIAINGGGSGNVSFSYSSQYASNLSVVSATVSSGGTNTVSNLTINGCTISVSSYSADATKTLTLTYKVNNGSNCTTTKNFNIDYIGIGPTVKAKYNITSTGTNQILTANDAALDVSKIISMKVDNVSVTPSKTYNFNTTGVHNIEFEFIENYGLIETFFGITNLIEVEISDAYNPSQQICLSMCSGCTNLTKLTFKGDIYSLDSNILYGCRSLTSIYIQETSMCPIIKSSTFASMLAYYGTLYYPQNVDFSSWFRKTSSYLGYWKWNTTTQVINGLRYLLYLPLNEAAVVEHGEAPVYSGNITIPSTVTYNNETYTVNTIDQAAFKNSSITSIVIPNSITSMYDAQVSGQAIFGNCTSLTSVTFGNGIIKIPYMCCLDCINLSNVTIPEGIQRIGTEAFHNCTSLHNISIPNSCIFIESFVFTGSGLTSISFPSGTTYIQAACKDCDSLLTITIPNTVTKINNNAFYGCTKVNTITINRATAPSIGTSVGNESWGSSSNTTGYNSGTTNVLYVPSGATGYDTSNWTNYLLNPSYGKFTVSATL